MDGKTITELAAPVKVEQDSITAFGCIDYPQPLTAEQIDRTANSRLEQLMPKLAQAAGVTEELKARDMMQWVGLMNSCKAQAEEILLAELINS